MTAVLERIFANTGNCVGEMKIRETSATFEGIILDCVHSFRECYTDNVTSFASNPSDTQNRLDVSN